MKLQKVNLKDLYSKGFTVYQLDEQDVSEIYSYFKTINPKDHAFDCDGISSNDGYTPPMYGISWSDLYSLPEPLYRFWSKLFETGFLSYFENRYGSFENYHPSVAFHQEGDGLPWHNDYCTEKWHISIALYLTNESNWKEEWGGSLHIGEWDLNEDGTGIIPSTRSLDTVHPKHGRMVILYNRRIDTAHRVERMKEAHERITVMMHLRLKGEMN
jgi:hypothetical protein